MYYAIMKEFPYYFIQSASKMELNCVEFVEDGKQFKTKEAAEEYFKGTSWLNAVEIKNINEELN